MSRELFGTDGVRGLANEYPLDADGARRIGMAVGSHFAVPGQEIVIGYDPRESAEQLVGYLTEGLIAAGVNVTGVGVIPTPGLAFVTRNNQPFVAGVMVTASHNPYQYNGVKVFDANGDKLTDETEQILNKLIIDGVTGVAKGQSSIDESLVKQYENFLTESVGSFHFSDLTLAVDAANGAASGLAQRVFERLGARLTPLFDKPNGRNINENCGATDTAALAERVTTNKLNLGVALDGDADRLIMIDELGREVKGDYIMYILAVANNLDGIVATVMSNLGFELALQKKGIKLARTQVGDRYVLEGLAQTGYKLGGEQSGHIILPDLLKTGDAVLAALHTIRAVSESGKSLAAWCDEVPLLPQALVNIDLADKSLLDRPELKAYIKEQTDKMHGQGRILIRPSGTEPLARVMIEADNAQEIAERIAAELQKLLSTAGAAA